MTDLAIERAARAVYRELTGAAVPWEQTTGDTRDRCRRVAQAALRSAQFQPPPESVGRGVAILPMLRRVS